MENEEIFSRDMFDEAAYARHYPDIRRALEEGATPDEIIDAVVVQIGDRARQ